ncbi:WD repeat-containing protein 1 [Gaertneriomyces sp. JEL0708]|nr:WD repeat-containing protein 1 [Gaertneriomyces sp. JEL0708]
MSYTRKGTFAAQPTTERGRPVHLGGDPKGVNFLYTNGRAVVIRNLANPEIATEYTQHTAQATVARYSPSGFYIASADVQGNIRIWDTVGSENIIKTETKAFSGKVNDLAWDFESKRIIAVGEGKDRFGHAFLFDTASSVGEIGGHSKSVNAVDIRPGRPLRAVTASDDMTVNFYHGVPFKFNKSINDHSRFVQVVRYSPSGDHFLSAGSDGKLFLYDGKEGTKIAELSTAEGAHKGGIYSASWSPDGKSLLTASADSSTKIWDVASQKVVRTWSMADQQVGSLWQGEHLITLSLSGDINYFNPTVDKVTRTVKGHQRGITALAVDQHKTLFSGSYDGRICSWSSGSETAEVPTGSGHSNQVSGITTENGKVYSVGMDDTFRSIEGATGVTKFTDNPIATGSLPKGVASSNGTSIYVTVNGEAVVISNGQRVSEVKLSWVPTSVAIAPNGVNVAIGGEDNKVHLFDLANGNLSETGALENNRGPITALSYSPDGTMLAAADTQRNVFVYDTATKQLKIHQWVFHNARVNCVAWSPDSLHAASGSLDTNVEVWSVEKPMKHISIKGAHLDTVSGVAFLDNNTLASAGGDAIIKLWSLTYP